MKRLFGGRPCRRYSLFIRSGNASALWDCCKLCNYRHLRANEVVDGYRAGGGGRYQSRDWGQGIGPTKPLAGRNKARFTRAGPFAVPGDDDTAVVERTERRAVTNRDNARVGETVLDQRVQCGFGGLVE